MMKHANPLALIFASSLGITSTAFAQTLPPYDAGNALKDAQPPRPAAPSKAPEPLIVQPDEKPLALPAGQTLTISAFRFAGAEAIAEAELQSALASFKGRALSMAEINAAAERITALFRSRGYLVARAYVPRQDASHGTLTIQVLIGRYGKLTLKNKSLVRDDVLTPYFASLSGDKAVSRSDLEGAMLRVSELPGASLPRLTVSPGEALGSSDFDAEIAAGKRVAAYVYGDNYGSRYTGRNRLSAGVEINSPSSRGDKLSVAGMTSDGSGLFNGRVAYSAPLASQGLRGEIAYSKTTYELGDIYKDLDATGYADTEEATLSWPLQHSRTQNLNLSLNLAARQMHDELRAAGLTTPKHAEAATLGMAYERYGQLFERSTYASISGGLTYGHLSISDQAQEDLNQAGADTVGRYGKANLTLLARLALTDKFSAAATLSVQQALFNKNLDSSEQLSISGTRGVMAYEQGTSGDNGQMLNAELRYTLPGVAGIEHSFALFADSAYVRLENGDYSMTRNTHLSDAGIGYNLNYKNLFVRAQYASALSKRPASILNGDDQRFLLLAGMSF